MKAESPELNRTRTAGMLVVLVCIVAIISSLYFFYQASQLQGSYTVLEDAFKEKTKELERTNQQLILPISQEDAIERAKKTFAFKNFSTTLFEDPTQQVEIAALLWDPANETYQWKVELMERNCGCAGGKEGLNSIVFYIDPVTGDVVGKEEHVGVTEENYARETCEKACHTE